MYSFLSASSSLARASRRSLGREVEEEEEVEEEVEEESIYLPFQCTAILNTQSL